MLNEKLVKSIIELKENGKGSTLECEMLWEELSYECEAYLKKKSMSLENSNPYLFSCAWDKEDFVQDVMEQIVKDIHNYDFERGSVKTWIGLKIKKVISNHFQQSNSENEVSVISIYQENDDSDEINIIDNYKSVPSAEGVFLKEELERTMDASKKNLKKEYKEVVMLCDEKGMKPCEAGECLQKSTTYISNTLNRAHNKMKEDILKASLEEELLYEYEI